MNANHHDRRIQRTRQALHQALIELILEKGFEAVTVQDIIDRANVGRSTFYLHFRDSEDLLLGGFENLWTLIESHLDMQAAQQASIWSLSLVIFRHAESYTQIYKAVVGKQSGQLMLTHLHKRLSLVFRNTLEGQWSSTQVPLDIAVHHLAHALISLLTWWIDHNRPYAPEQINMIFQQLTRSAVENGASRWPA